MWQLHYTGHPLFDVGLAAVTAFVRKENPEDLSEGDLESIAAYIENYYIEPPLSSFLTASLMNSDFTQPAYRNNPERKRAYARRVSQSFRSSVPTSGETCVFTGQAALGIPLSLKEGKDALPSGRAFRQHVPLVSAEGVINFSPGGSPGLPISGIALLCLQFFPMGCHKCRGRLLAIHSEDPSILLGFAREALQKNLKAVSQSRRAGNAKLPDTSVWPRTLLITTLLMLDRRIEEENREFQPYSVTMYHLTNSGQSSPLDAKNPPLSIEYLSMEITRFIHIANSHGYQTIWNELARCEWESSKRGSLITKLESRHEDTSDGEKRNYLFEDMFGLPELKYRFIHNYLLRAPKLAEAIIASGQNYDFHSEVNLVSWELTEIFLREVTHMNRQRIEQIRLLGDRFAHYVHKQNDKRFLRNFSAARREDEFRALLLRANLRYASTGKGVLFGFDTYCTVFFEDDGETLVHDWLLARDLVLIRMVEWLRINAESWLAKNSEALLGPGPLSTIRDEE